MSWSCEARGSSLQNLSPKPVSYMACRFVLNFFQWQEKWWNQRVHKRSIYKGFYHIFTVNLYCLCVYLNEKKKQRSHMNDCFKHGKVLYADQPQLVKWSSYDALQTSLLYFWSLFCRTWRCTTSNTTVPIISILLTNKHVVFIYSVTIYHERKQRIVDGQGAPNIN